MISFDLEQLLKDDVKWNVKPSARAYLTLFEHNRNAYL